MFLQGSPRSLERLERGIIEQYEVDFFERRFVGEMRHGFGEHDFGAFVHRETRNARAYGRKRDGFEAFLRGDAERVRRGAAERVSCGASAKLHAGGVDYVASLER